MNFVRHPLAVLPHRIRDGARLGARIPHPLIKTTDSVDGTTMYAWDARGNFTRKTNGANTTTYTWRSDNRLLSIADGAQKIYYGYNANGQRIKRYVVKGATTTRTHYALDTQRPNSEVLIEYTQVGTAPWTNQANVFTPDGVGELLQSGNHTTFADVQGNTRLVIDNHGNATALSYDAFGLEIGAANTSVSHRYTGEYFDQDSGLYHLRARDYDPSIGRFISMDEHPGTQTIPLTLNKYMYGNADPVNGIGPSGNETLGGLMSGLNSAASGFAVTSYHAVLRAIQFGAGRTVSAGVYQKLRLATAALASKLLGPATQLMRRCARNLKTCVPDFNVFIVGDTTPEHRGVVTTAMTEFHAPANLTRYKTGYSRKWLIQSRNCKGSRNDQTDCDEYPYASSYQGGEKNMKRTFTQIVTAGANRSAGAIHRRDVQNLRYKGQGKLPGSSSEE